MANRTGKIYGINGPVIYLKGNTGFAMSEMVYVGGERLVGEVIALDKDRTTIQVYEETSGLRPGETVEASGGPVSVLLAPGILDNIFDGIERPLEKISESGGAFITKGVSVDSLDEMKRWETHITVREGDYLHGGDIFAEVPETRAIVHKCMVPPDLEGTVVSVVPDGNYTITEPLLTLRTGSGEEKRIPMAQRWPIRKARPVSQRFAASVPLVTGQRIIDTMFPIAKGGTAAIPGGFGTGKTMTQHQIAKWSDADIIIYIGCGERGNEMTQVLEEFGELTDPRTGNPLMDRTTLIANTSNMPVAAREASIYTGLTLAEYYRDMGYDVAIMADSTSRWAEALRELSGRLEEMPAEEGFPAYLASRQHHRRRVAPGRGFLRACDPEYEAFRALLLGAGQEPCLRPAFPGHPLAVQLQRVPDGSGALVSGQCVAQIHRLPEPAHGAPQPGEQPSGDREADRQRRAAGRPEADPGDRPGHPARIPAAERLPQGRYLRVHGEAVPHDGHDPLSVQAGAGPCDHGASHVRAEIREYI